MKRYSGKLSTIFQRLLFAGLILSMCGSLTIAEETSSLPEVNRAEGVRSYNFKPDETVELTEDMGTTATGEFSVLGVNNSSNSINLAGFSGFVVSQTGTTLKISDLTIENGLSDIGSVIYNTANNSSLTLTNLVIKNNSIVSDSDGLGGAIYTNSAIKLVNTSLIGNYAKGSSTGDVLGGAIYANNDVNITADNKNIEITGNYTQSSDNKNAIYISNSDSTLTMEAKNNGQIIMNDNVSGADGYNVVLKGDRTGTIKPLGSIENGKVSASNVDISFADNKANNHRIDNLTIGNNVTFNIDADLAAAEADTLSTGTGSGTMKVSSINILSAPTSDSTKVQVLKSAGNIGLDISQLHRETSLKATMYNDDILAQSVSLGTTDKENDSIILTGVKDVLYEMVKDAAVSKTKYFKFRTDAEYNLTKDLTELGNNQGNNLNFYVNNDRQTGAANHRVINANGHTMFKYAENQAVCGISIYNTTIKNAKTTTNGSVANVNNSSSAFWVESSSVIDNNESEGDGGAIYVPKGQVVIKNSTLSNNTAGGSGGAIYNSSNKSSTILNTDFKNNTAGNHGGAIYTNKSMTIKAEGGSSTFEGNSANGQNNAIYVDGSGETLTFNATNNGTINLNDKISGTTDKYNVEITGDSTGNVNLNVTNPDKTVEDYKTMENANVSLSSGKLTLKQEDILKNNQFTAKGGTLNLVNNEIGSTDFSKLNTSGTTNVAVDVDLAGAKMDRVTAKEYGTISGKLKVTNMNLISETPNQDTRIKFADSAIRNKVSTSVKTVSYSRVYKYVVSYDANSADGYGYFVFSRGGGHHTDDFNPAVLTGAIGQQIAYANQLANYEYATYHSNTYMMLPRRNRLGMENKIANNEIEDFENDHPTYKNVQEEVKSIWFRPYTSFESIPLKNGPSVTSINYGVLAGGDSDLIDIGHGFKFVYGGYIGYNGNSYHYKGINSVQQGGLVGATANIYKGNFFNTLTANIGWQINDSDTSYGSDFTNMLITGFADKFGYNFEMSGGRIILQPSLNMGYTYIGSWDYTASNGAKINTDPLHVMHFIPGVKIIGNTKNGWQPYAVINVVCNFGGKSHYSANNIVLPSMSIDPYVEYGLGIQKRWADKYSGFAQATVRSGGRRGAALLFGFRYMLGQIAEKTANLLHADPSRKIVMFKEKKDPNIVIEPIRRWGGAKSKVASGRKDSKLRNILKKTKQKLCFWYKTDVSAKMVEEVYPDGVIKPEISAKKINKKEVYTPHDVTETVTVIEKPVKLKKQFIEHKVAEQTMLDYNNRIKNQQEIGELNKLIDNEQEPAPSSLITEAPLFKTDAILKRHKPANKSLYINQNYYTDYSTPKSFNDFCFEMINLKF